MKRFLRVIGAGVCLGAALGIVRAVFQIDDGVFWRWFLGLAAAVIIGAALFNILYSLRYQRKMDAAVRLLEEGRTAEYIDAVEALRRTAKGKYIKNYLTLNLSAGYCDLKQFDKATDILEGLSGERLPGVVRMVQRLNLCVCYFYTGQNARAMELYRAGRKEFAAYRKTAVYGGSLAVLDMFAAIAENRPEDARTLLRTARKTWDRPRLRDDYKYIEDLLAEGET